MRLGESLPSKDDERVIRFCESICPDSKPFYVPIDQSSGFPRLQCFQNVAKKVQMADGEAIHGWEISQLPKVYLEARFHAVWKSPDGRHVDVTPEEARQPRVLFLPDVRHSSKLPAVQRHRFLLARDTVQADRYLKIADELEGLLFSQLLGGLPRGDQAIKRQVLALQAEAKMIREGLQR